MSNRRIRVGLLATTLVVVPAYAADNGYTNLQVLPPDISREELGERMLENLRGLGLPRLAGEGCLYCHVGDLEKPRGEWDYASDAKPMKEKARVMMAMVEAVNGTYLAKLKGRIDESSTVSCASCHAGRTDPRPLPDVLWAAYEKKGIDAAVETYRTLRARYFGADAYDFRVGVLPRLAVYVADHADIGDAIALAQLNVEVYPEEPAAERAWVALRLERTIDADGVDAALRELKTLEPSLGADVLTPALLDSLAWRLNRSNREPAGHALIAANLERFPEEYTAIESMAFVLSSTERKEEAFAMLEGWLEKHPDHARARRLLINLRKDE